MGAVELKRKLLFGTTAYNAHVQNMARALHEAGALYEYVVSGGDTYRRAPMRALRRAIAVALPGLDRELSRRAIDGLPKHLIRTRWRWDLPRVIASRMRCDVRLIDWLWEQEELALDRACAKMIRRREVGGFIGVEYGALASLESARREGKASVVAFLSPHHATHDRWLLPEYDKFPELRSPKQPYFDARETRRQQRRDSEAAVADWIVSGSSFTTRSLVAAGLHEDKILTVPLGAPPPLPKDSLPSEPQPTLRVIYVGTVSVRKGAHYLLRAWERVAGPGMELHLYGAILLPDSVCKAALAGRNGGRIVFHGSIPARQLGDVYEQSSVLVLPTLCDGFGQVVTDALAHGLPVITTSNAGAADIVEHGKSGLIIPAADEDALAAALEWCADHRPPLFDMREAALAAAGSWTWEHFRRRFGALAMAAVHGADQRPAHSTVAIGVTT